MSSSFSFPTRIARRFPDPNFTDRGVERHILFVPASRVPTGLPFDPNAREPNINRRVYRTIESSLLNLEGEPGTFHLKHRGITLVASSIKKKSDEEYTITFDDGHGILDGGHTYALLTKDRDEDIPPDQFVKFEVLTNVPEEWIVDLAAGLNTSVQVQPMSLDSLAGRFNWIKEAIADKPYAGQIAWREGERGDFDARDIVSLLTCFNVGLYPNTGDDQPIVAYEKKSQALRAYEEDQKSFEKLGPILTDILTLHDTIRRDSRKYWNEAGGNFGGLAFVESKKRGNFSFPFTEMTSKYRLMNGALYPMLAAFRWMVEEKGNKYRWRGGFTAVIERWEESAALLVRATAEASRELGRNPNAIGKSRNHWANLHARVAMNDLMGRNKK